MDKCILGDRISDGFDNSVNSIPNLFKSRKSSSFAPTYDELGKACRDIFSGGYHFGLVKLDFKTKIEDFAEVKAGGTLVSETGDFSGNLTTSYKMKDHGLTFAEKWNTNQTLDTEISLEDKLAEGLKLGLGLSFSAATGDKSCTVKGEYKTEKLALTMGLGPIGAEDSVLNGSAVYTYDSWLVGYQMAFNPANTEFTKNNVALGYSIGDFVLHSSVHNLNEFGGSIYRKVYPNLEAGIQLAWQSDDTDATKFGIGCKYDIDENISLRAKVDESCGVGLSFQTKIRDGITCTMSALINGKNMNEGGHKIGMALDLEA